MISYKSEKEDWDSYMQDEHSLDEYIEKFNSKLTREEICGEVKVILIKEYLTDIGSQMGYKVI